MKITRIRKSCEQYYEENVKINLRLGASQVLTGQDATESSLAHLFIAFHSSGQNKTTSQGIVKGRTGGTSCYKLKQYTIRASLCSRPSIFKLRVWETG